MGEKLDLDVSVISKVDKDTYYKMIDKYGIEMVWRCFDADISKIMDQGGDLEKVQYQIWEKYGYYLAFLDHDPFESIIVNKIHNYSVEKIISIREDSLQREKGLSFQEEVYYGFHLLKKDYISIFLNNPKDVIFKDADVISLDVKKIFSSIKSITVCDQVLELFDSFYKVCNRTSNFDNEFFSFLIEYRKNRELTGNVPDVSKFSFTDGSDEEICEDELLDQVKMYISYSIARDKFFSSNIRFVEYLVREYSFDDDYFKEDLFQECVFAVANSIYKFDIRKCCKFSGFVGRYIKFCISRTQKNMKRVIRIPEYLLDDLIRLDEFKKQFIMENGREPLVSEIARFLGKDENRVLKFLRIVEEVHCVSLSCNVLANDRFITSNDYNGRDFDKILVDDILDENVCIEEDFIFKELSKGMLEFMEEVLTPFEKNVLLERVGYFTNDPMTLKELASKFGCTWQWIRLVEQKAKKKILATKKGRSFNPYQ